MLGRNAMLKEHVGCKSIYQTNLAVLTEDNREQWPGLWNMVRIDEPFPAVTVVGAGISVEVG